MKQMLLFYFKSLFRTIEGFVCCNNPCNRIFAKHSSKHPTPLLKGAVTVNPFSGPPNFLVFGDNLHTSSNRNTGQNDTPIKVGLVTWPAPGHCISGHYFVGNMQPTIESAMKEGRYGPDVVVVHIPTVPVTMVLPDGVMSCCFVNGTISARKD